MITEDQIRRAVQERTEYAHGVASRRTFARRELADIMRRLDDTSHSRAVVLLGPRQVGKTTLLCQALSRLQAAGATVWYCDFTDRTLGGAGLREVVRALGLGGRDERTFVLFDEVHYVDGWERELKLLVDERAARFAVADSAAAVLRAAMRDAGAGRWSTFSVHPMGLVEWLALREHCGLPEQGTSFTRSTSCAEYLRRGGFPAFALRQPSLAETHRVLRDDLVERAIRADVGPARGIRNVHGLELMFRWVAADSGLQVTYSRAKKDLGTGADTTRSWLSALEDTGLIWLLPTWNLSLAKQARRPAKAYATDPSLVAAFVPGGDRETDARFVGKLVETACACAVRGHVEQRDGRFGYFERRKRDKVVGEADFVFETGGRRVLVEATASRHPEKKIRKVAERAREIGDVDVACIATPSVLEQAGHRSGDCDVHLVPLYEVLTRLGRGEELAW